MERITNFSNYKFRCHAVGKLMTGVNVGLTPRQEETFQAYDARYRGQGKPLTEKQQAAYFELGAKKKAKPELSTTAKSYLKELHRAEFLGRTNHIQSRYIDKGLMVESKSVTLYSEVSGFPFFKNKKRKQNDYLSGLPDNVATGKIRDIKSSWSLESFPLYDAVIPTKDYEWQLQAYMELFGMAEAELIYCLVDTPHKLIDDHLRQLDWKHNIMDMNGDIRPKCRDLVTEAVGNHIFSREGLEEYCQQSTAIELDWFGDFTPIPAELRCKIFEVVRDPKMIAALYEQIENARKYLNQITENIADLLKITV